MTRSSKITSLQIWRIVKIGAMIIAPILLLSLPADYFDHAGSSISVFEWIGVSGHYSQGLTRGCMHLLHGDLQGAVAFNRLSIAVLPLIGGLWFWGLYGEITRYRRIYLKKDDSHGL